MRCRRFGDLDFRFLQKLSSQRLERGLTPLYASAGEMPPSGVCMPDEQHTTFIVQNGGSNAKSHGIEQLMQHAARGIRGTSQQS